jgi:hypothetical protein
MDITLAAPNACKMRRTKRAAMCAGKAAISTFEITKISKDAIYKTLRPPKSLQAAQNSG